MFAIRVTHSLFGGPRVYRMTGGADVGVRGDLKFPRWKKASPNILDGAELVETIWNGNVKTEYFHLKRGGGVE